MQQAISRLLDDPKLQRLMRVYEDAGFEIRLIGGCIRDALLDRPIFDKDLATTATPDQGMDLLKIARIQAVPTGITHGTITAVIDKTHYEITTLRADINTDGRHAEVFFTHDWKLDSRRRDFTINALSADRNGHLHDTQQGLGDLKNKTLRFIGDLIQRMTEDMLRLLRYFRFASQLDWETDPVTVQLCHQMALQLKILSRERIQSELLKLVMGKGAVRVLKTMNEARLWEGLMDHLPNIPALEKLIQAEEQYQKQDAFRRIVCLGMQQFLVETRDWKKRLKALGQIDPAFSTEKNAYYFGVEAVIDHALLSGHPAVIAKIQGWQKPVFPLQASDLPDLQGKNLGQKLKEAESHWADQGFKPDKTALLTRLVAKTDSDNNQ